MKILFVSPSFYPAAYYGGPTVLHQSLCDALSRNGQVQLQVLTTDADGPRRRVKLNDGGVIGRRNFEIEYCRRQMPPDISIRLITRLPRMIRGADVVHLHGVYSFTTIPTLALCSLMGKPVVWSASGALQRWARTKRSRSKLVFEKICDALCKVGRVILHSASETESIESERRLKNVSEIVIPYGVSIPASDMCRTSSAGPLRLLYLGRLHPIKGLENLLHAMHRASARTSLAICGEGDQEYEMMLRSLVAQLGLQSQVRFLGPVSGDEKERQFREADVCVVPSFKESFGAVVTESLARAVPVIASRETPWPQIEEVGCGLWVSNEPRELARAIDQAATMPLQEQGLRGREWMKKEFSWDKCAAQFIDTYRSLLAESISQSPKVIADPKAA